MEVSKITTLFKGEFVLVDLVDETIELTVENNVYSRSESLELLTELQESSIIIMANACKENKDDSTYSEQMQDALEPIEEPINSKANLFDEIGVATSGSYENHLPRLIKEIENRAIRNNKETKDE